MTTQQTDFSPNNNYSVGDSSSDVIRLSLPVNPAYVSAVRLTASSVANRLGFDIDEIEDVKAAISEACTFVIKNMPANVIGEYAIVFYLGGDLLTIDIKCNFNLVLEALDDEMGVLMIRTLMDSFTFISDSENNVNIKMEKRHKSMF